MTADKIDDVRTCRRCLVRIAPTGHDDRWVDSKGRLNCPDDTWAHQPIGGAEYATGGLVEGGMSSGLSYDDCPGEARVLRVDSGGSPVGATVLRLIAAAERGGYKRAIAALRDEKSYREWWLAYDGPYGDDAPTFEDVVLVASYLEALELKP